MHRDGIRREKVHDEGIGQIKPVNSSISEREGSNLRPIYDQNGIFLKLSGVCGSKYGYNK